MKKILISFLNLKLFNVLIPISYHKVLTVVEKRSIFILIHQLIMKKHRHNFVFFNFTYEKSLIYGHESLTKIDDKVLIIGGGEGISGLYASKKACNGFVQIFEAGEDAYNRIVNTKEFKESRNISVHHILVGENINVYGGSVQKAKLVNPDKIGFYDVIELDCEGSEYGILENLKNMPRNIICEFHPVNNIHYTIFFKKLFEKYKSIYITNSHHQSIDFLMAINDLIQGKIIHMFLENIEG